MTLMQQLILSTEDEGWKANVANELVEIRSGSFEVQGMEIDEILQIL